MANEFKIKNGLVTPTLQATDPTDSTLSTNGAAVFSGGVGIVKNLNVGGNLTVSGTFNPASINNAQIGNTTPNTGAFTTLTANAAVTFTQNTGSVNATSGTLVVTGGVGISENLNVGQNLTVTGNLTVNGTTTTINSTTITVDDKNIELGSIASPTDVGADSGGITLRGTSDKSILWLNSTNRWTFNTGIEATSIENTPVGSTTRSTGAFTSLTSNAATTFTAGTASTDTSTGTVVITGGLGVSGRINAANFDGIVGANAAAAGSFTTLGVSGVVSVNTTSNNQSYTTSGAGVITVSSGTTGTINNMSIGATTRSTGDFTTLAANDTATLTGAITANTGTNNQSYTTTGAGTITITSATTGSINNMNIGATTRGSGAFTTLAANGIVTLTDATNNTGISTGALQITNGGAYIAGNLYVGGTINLSGVAVQQIGQITTTAAGWNLP